VCMGIGMRMLVRIDQESEKTMYLGEYLDQKARSNEKLQKLCIGKVIVCLLNVFWGGWIKSRFETAVNVHSMHGQMRSA
jgi:hypothetical protein